VATQRHNASCVAAALIALCSRIDDAATPARSGYAVATLLSKLTLEAYMNQQAVNVAVERRASSNRADVRFLRLKEVLAICGKSRSSVYDAIKKGDFPKPVKLSGRSSAWIKSEVEQWAVECIRASRQDQRP
jgi:prophage regulatory protein